MNLFSFLLLFLLFFRVQFGGSTDRSFPHKGSWPTGELSKNAASLIQGTEVIPCSNWKSSSGKEHLKSTVHLLCKRQEQQLQLWQGLSPSRSRTASVPNEALLVEREKDLSTYNWNVFGLRYGKRQARNTRKKL